MEKGATAAPFFFRGEVGLAFLAGLLLPALGFLCHCLLSPPSSGLLARALTVSCSVAAAWHAHPEPALHASRHFPCLAHSPSSTGLGRVRLNSSLGVG